MKLTTAVDGVAVGKHMALITSALWTLIFATMIVPMTVREQGIMMTSNPDPYLWGRVDELADYLEITPQALRMRASRKQWRRLKSGRYVYYRLEDVLM